MPDMIKCLLPTDPDVQTENEYQSGPIVQRLPLEGRL